MDNILKCDMCGADAGNDPYHATIDENGHVHVCDGCFYPEHYDLGVLWRERERMVAKLNSSERRLDEVTASRATIERQRDDLLRALPLYTQPFPTDEALLRQALDALTYWLEHGETPGSHDIIQRTHGALQDRLAEKDK